MRATTMIPGLVALVAASALLSTDEVVPRQDDEVWRDENGNTRISVSSDTINWGNAPPWHVFDDILRHCSSTGCSSSNEMRYESHFVIGGQSRSQDIVVAVSASFAIDGPGSREDLVEVAKAIMGGTPYDVTETTYQIGPDCPAVGVPCPPPDTATMDQYQHIQGLEIRYDHDETGFEAFMNIWVEIDEVDLGSGFCSEIMTIGGTVAGLIHGLAGGAFSLASLACDI